MPVNKNALLRYRIIDACLTNPQRKYPGMDLILQKIEEQLGTPISDSMFNKDISQMRSIYNAPIKFDRHNKGYYYGEEGFSIREFPLTHDEIEALDYSTALLHQLKGTHMFQQFENAINKVIEGYRISKVIGKSESQIIQVEEPVKMEGGEWLETILRSIVEKQSLKITYQGYGKQPADHEFSAYLLKEYRNRWYTIGYSMQKKNVIVLALDRIQEIKPVPIKFQNSDNFSPADFFKYSFGITQVHDAKPQKVILSFNAAAAPYILSQPLHHSQKLTRQNGEGIMITLEVYLTAELKMAILSFGADVQVIEPAALRNDIAHTIKDMKNLYQGALESIK